MRSEIRVGQECKWSSRSEVNEDPTFSLFFNFFDIVFLILMLSSSLGYWNFCHTPFKRTYRDTNTDARKPRSGFRIKNDLQKNEEHEGILFWHIHTRKRKNHITERWRRCLFSFYGVRATANEINMRKVWEGDSDGNSIYLCTTNDAMLVFK